MKSIVVIADDLTGAAEMAGIGLRFGLETRLVVDRTAPAPPDNPQLTVINADTRALPEADAVRIVSQLAAVLEPSALLFKKIDSVVRGHVAAEIDAVLAASRRHDHVLFLPHNPTRNRIVRSDGSYLVDGVPLARTAFALDPDHPARTSNIIDRVARSKCVAELRQDANEPLETRKINVAVAERFETVREWSRRCTQRTLIVGAADLFTATLQTLGYTASFQSPLDTFSGRRLYLCGSTSTSSRRLLRTFATSNGLEIVSDLDGARKSIKRSGLAVVMSPEPGGVEMDPREIETAIGSIAASVVKEGLCDWMFVEGGATATAACQALGWTSLEVEAELASGVVVLKPDVPLRFVIKPGSYLWPDSVLTFGRTPP